MYDGLTFYDTLITPVDAADMLGIGMNSIYKLLKEQKINALRIGRTWKIPKRSIQDFILREACMKAYGWN